MLRQVRRVQGHRYNLAALVNSTDLLDPFAAARHLIGKLQRSIPAIP